MIECTVHDYILNKTHIVSVNCVVILTDLKHPQFHSIIVIFHGATNKYVKNQLIMWTISFIINAA